MESSDFGQHLSRLSASDGLSSLMPGQLWLATEVDPLALARSGGTGFETWAPVLSERTLMRASNSSSCSANVASANFRLLNSFTRGSR
jgi:hypothetical protein